MKIGLIRVIIHIFMEISQGNSLCSYLYFKQAKMSFNKKKKKIRLIVTFIDIHGHIIVSPREEKDCKRITLCQQRVI
jgi:hypothetical protein